jgi:hypothetical protein
MVPAKGVPQSERRPDATREHLPVPLNWEAVSRICREYVEMPGLRLTPEQAQRFWALDAASCSASLDALVTITFLRRMRDGKYARGWAVSSA